MAHVQCLPRGTHTVILAPASAGHIRSIKGTASAPLSHNGFSLHANFCTIRRSPWLGCRNGRFLPAEDRRPARFKLKSPARRSSRGLIPACQIVSALSKGDELVSWLTDKGFPEQPVVIGDAGVLGRGCFAKRPIKAGEPAVQIPENFTISNVDIANHPNIAAAAQDKDDLVGLTLWLLYERSLGPSSVWHPYLRTLPETTLSPLLWTPEEQLDQLQGSPVLAEVQARVRGLESVYESLRTNHFDASPEVFSQEAFSLEAFKKAFAVVLSRVVYLPSVEILALVPFADMFNHQSDSRAMLDYRLEDDTMVLVADRDYEKGEQVLASYGPERTNADIFISYGFVPQKNPADFLELKVSLVTTDSLFGMKKQVAEEVGFSAEQAFPLYLDRLPTQLLTYVRLARLQDPALFAKVAFERDAMLTQANEYEVLMILIGECRDKLAAYKGSYEEDLQMLNRKNLSPKEKAATSLRMSEKKILNAAMAALRNRLAPIRGVPTKGGQMQDPNSDIKEVFAVMEAGLSAPRKILFSIFGKSKE